LEKRTNKEIAEIKEQKDREIAELKELTSKEIEEIKKAGPKQVNQVLQVICITNNDNYLDILTERMGDFSDAIEYIKDCALSDISGDCKLIEKIYMGYDNNLPNRVVCMKNERSGRSEKCIILIVVKTILLFIMRDQRELLSQKYRWVKS